MTQGRDITHVLERHRKTLIMVPGVVGIGEGELEGKPCVKVFVERKTNEIDERIPSTLDGYAVCVVESGRFRALDS